MSLVGNLEELGLGDILQIVSLSRKTGILTLSSKGKTGTVFFRQGQVVRAASSTFQSSLGKVLIQKGIIDQAVLQKALALQELNAFSELLGVILVNTFGVSQVIIEDVVREQIENVVFSLFAWTDGTFNFKVQNTIEAVDGTKMDPLQFMLDQGLNPQFLAMEGTRILDEKRHAVAMGGGGDYPADDEMDFAFDLIDDSDVPVASSPGVQQSLVVVDDDGPTVAAIAAGLTEMGFVVHALTRSEDALIKIDTLYRCGEHPAVLVDLIMPKMDGSGVLGGIELLELLHNNFKDLLLIAMADYHHAEAGKKVRELGCPLIIKPRRVEIDSPVMSSFLTRVTAEIGNDSDHSILGEWQDRFNLGDELRIELGEDSDIPPVIESSQQPGGFSLLRGMLEELNNPDLQGGGVLLLVLRFASEFVNRAIVFTITDQIISGFGQFGITGGAVSGDECVRSIHLSRESVSLFTKPLQTGQPCTFSPAVTPVDAHFFEQLGGGVPAEVFVGPLVSRSRVVGFLYGDNCPDTRPIGDIEPLAIFLAQAGISIEKSLLERQLNERAIP